MVISKQECALFIDASGLPCPLPLLKAKQGLQQIAEGEVLKVVASDPGSVRDFHSFCELSEHELLQFEEQESCYHYTIRKAGEI